MVEEGWPNYLVPPHRYGGAAVRREKIAEKVVLEGYASFEQLAKHFHVSQRTIRRDIALLDEHGAVAMVSGGAKVAGEFGRPTPFSARHVSEQDVKAALGRRVRELIKPDESVGIDAGTTAAFAARELTAMPDLTVVSNSLEVMLHLGNEPLPALIAIGGTFDAERRAFYGSMARSSFQGIHLSTAVLSCSGIQPNGFACATETDAEMKAMLAAAADRRILVATAEKFSRSAPIRFVTFSDIDIVVTDHRVGQETLDMLAHHGVRIVQVPIPLE